MATRVNMHQAKSDLSRLVAKALQGEEVIIMRDNKPIAKLVPIHDERVPGLARGRVSIAEDFDSPLPDDLLDSFEA
ncbi:MAG: type II toxin-antitoxin system prevent-host-death family antitoxin [Dehalococcoidia bacterium]|nr:type II toxin-antitoxin system prevent-host-death family antitoxin [Dehalococcoidia bacterium]